MATKLLLIPGMGADERLMGPQASAFPGAVVSAWPDLDPAETLSGLAGRIASRYGVGPGWVVAGVSMGGMLAQEVARRSGADAAVVIASCRHPRAIPRAARMLEQAGRVAPDSVIDSIRRFRNRWLIDLLGPRTDDQRRLLAAMSTETPVPRLRWSARAIFDWTGAEDLTLPVYQIHGTRDRVILCRRAGVGGKPPPVIIEGGGHVINLTHAGEVNAVIARAMSGDPPPGTLAG
ncbi:MAG: alpha/beta hydrolase [Phycisphaeraceae bacterium]|nr:MAG: alpha/beta hydrolase [Phycisphaeraceae bacterium]